MIHVTSRTLRYIYIGDDEQNLLVIDMENGPDEDQGGLYLWHFTAYEPIDLDLNGNRTLKIIGVDMI